MGRTTLVSRIEVLSSAPKGNSHALSLEVSNRLAMIWGPISGLPAEAAPKTGLEAPKAGVAGVLAAPKLKPVPCIVR